MMVTRKSLLGVLLIVVCVVCGWVIYALRDSPKTYTWGSESLIERGSLANFIEESISIPLANACGLGASSCFRCHNGQRAKAPSQKPWHLDHSRVNFSCSGCHGGNPRLIDKDRAHTNLIANPLNNPQMCAKCHTGQNINELIKKYEVMKQQGFKHDIVYLSRILNENFINIGR